MISPKLIETTFISRQDWSRSGKPGQVSKGPPMFNLVLLYLLFAGFNIVAIRNIIILLIKEISGCTHDAGGGLVTRGWDRGDGGLYHWIIKMTINKINISSWTRSLEVAANFINHQDENYSSYCPHFCHGNFCGSGKNFSLFSCNSSSIPRFLRAEHYKSAIFHARSSIFPW